MAAIDYLQGPSGRRVLHLHTEKTTSICERDDGDLDDLRKRLIEPAPPIRDDRDMTNDANENSNQ